MCTVDLPAWSSGGLTLKRKLSERDLCLTWLFSSLTESAWRTSWTRPGRCFTLTLLTGIAQTKDGYLDRATKELFAKKEELSFPNYQDKSKLADDIGGFFVRKINKIRSDIDAVDIDLSVRNALPPDQEVDAAHAFHSFQPLSENAVSALIR